jgi:hypothetical protein
MDVDGVNMKLIKIVGPAICTPLSYVFSLCIKQGIFSEKLKCSRTVPIFKLGNPTTYIR